MFLATNRSPRPQSNRISAATRESEHPRNAAFGAWLPDISVRRAALCCGWSRSPLMKRSLPWTRSSQASCGVTRGAVMFPLSSGACCLGYWLAMGADALAREFGFIRRQLALGRGGAA
ncbi:hypothetical protein ACFPRL_09240 [Pseudoclavibacter helvolus]